MPMKKINLTHYTSPVGELIIGSLNEQLCLCDWRGRKARAQVDKRISSGLNAEFQIQTTDFNQTVIDQLEAYFSLKKQCINGNSFIKANHAA